MGQQQLLLLVLSAIIVGVSIMIGINMFTSSAVQANQDAVLQDCLNIAARAQEWYRKPTVMGGGGRSFATLINVGILNIKASNVNTSAPFLLSNDGQTLTIVGTGTEGPGPLTVTVVVAPDSLIGTTYTQ